MSTDEFIDWLEDSDGRMSFDVDKAWHAIHFTLTGDAWEVKQPLGAVVLGGEPFGDDVGYGPARWLPPEAVVIAAHALAVLPTDEFAARLDFAAMNEQDIYPPIWDRDPDAEHLVDFVVAGYDEVRTSFATAAAAGLGFVVSLL